MPKINKPLTEKQIQAAKPKDKAYRIYDTGGLTMLIRPSGTKVWQYRYQFPKYDHKTASYQLCSNIYTLGKYPDVPSPDARDQLKAIKKQIAQGINPNQEKQAQRFTSAEQSQRSFEAVAREWHSKQLWAKKHAANILSRLEKDVFPIIGYKQVDKITAQDILAVLHQIEDRGALDVAKRIGHYCTNIFEYAIIKSYCGLNPAAGRAKAVKTYKREHRRNLSAQQLPEFFKALKIYRGGKIVQQAIKFLFLTFVRPGELREARWDEIDEEKALWRIPAERMKMKRPHIVPLSSQALDVLKQLKPLIGESPLLFPGDRGLHKPISDVTLTKAYIIMGFHDRAVPHGTRATASTILNEHGFNRDHIEMQLAHVSKDKIRAAYNHAEYLPERKKMMQWWGDYIEKMSKKDESND